MQAKERVEGNGLTYIEYDVADMAKTLLQLKDIELRKKLSNAGINKIMNFYSWDKIAANRIKDYQSFL